MLTQTLIACPDGYYEIYQGSRESLKQFDIDLIKTIVSFQKEKHLQSKIHVSSICQQHSDHWFSSIASSAPVLSTEQQCWERE